MELAAGTILERYTVERTLGAGGMAVVYLARHNQIGSLHAVKVLTLHGPVLRERLLQEGRVQAGLRHPNIVTVTDVVEVRGAPALVLEYVRGPALSALLRETRLSLPQVDLVARGILRGVAAAHREGLVHRDLKPANVLLAVSEEGLTPKIADFGLGKLVRSEVSPTRTRSGATLGTPAYMAPEQIRDAGGVDERADVFALGAILYELLTGQMAFPGEDTLDTFERIAAGRFEPLDRETLPARMVDAVERALSVEPDARFPDAAGLYRAWTGQVEGQPAEPVSDSDPWSEALLRTAETLAPSAAESLDRDVPRAPATPDTFALSLEEPAEEGAGPPSEPLLEVEALDPANLARWMALAGTGAAPFALGGLVAVLGSLGAIRMGGGWALGLILLAVAGTAALGALAVLWRTGRVTRFLWWMIAPALLASLANVGTGIGAHSALERLEGLSIGEVAPVAAGATAIALTTELIGLTLCAMLLIATSEVAAGLVLKNRGVGDLAAPRRLVVMGLALVLGTTLWLATTLWITQGGVPFVVFLILMGSAVGAAAVSFPIPDPDERTSEARLLTVLAGALAVLSAAKIVWLQQVIGVLEAVEPGGGVEAAMTFTRAIQTSGASLVVGWGAAAAVVGGVALLGPGHPRIPVGTTARDLGPLLLLLVPLLGTKLWADRGVNDLTSEVVPSFIGSEVQRTLDLHLTDRSLIRHRTRFPGVLDPAFRVAGRWREADQDLPDGAIVVEVREGSDLAEGDVILAVNGRRVGDVPELLTEVLGCACTGVRLTVERNGALQDLHTEVRGVQGAGERAAGDP